ncbi:MAG: DUF3494 domain-containing protein [Thermoplasmata archaeon]|nr:DUF3494 domain-containing protein [Thermoplasmata archaeon]
MLVGAFAVMASVAPGTSVRAGTHVTASNQRASQAPAATCGQAVVPLGSASTYAALSGTTVTSTGATALTGDIGVSPGSAVTGFPPGTYSGTKNVANAASATAESDLTTAFNTAAARSNCAVSVAGNIGGQTLTPGLYKSTSSLAVSSGDLTLSGGGNPNGVFVFQVASALTTTSGRAVVLSNGAQAGNVYWEVGSSVTIGTTSMVQGTLMSYASITMLAGSHLNGRALARTGDVTLSASAIIVPTVSTATTHDVTFTESGLTLGTGWAATFDGVQQSSTTKTLVFTVVDGSYHFAMEVTPGFTTSPLTGTIPVSGAAAAQTITYTPNAAGTFTVAFTEFGLVSGTSWSVTLHGVQKTSTALTLGFTEINGTTSYTVGSSDGYTVSPSSGSLTVNGITVNQAITFTTMDSSGGNPSPGSSSPLGISSWGWALIAIAIVGGIAAVGAGAVMMRRRNRAT